MAKRILRLAAPGDTLTVDPRDTIRVMVNFTYQGPAWRETLYGALYAGSWPGPIDEVSGGAGAKGWDIPERKEPATITDMYVDVPVPKRGGETFGIYVKLGNILNERGYNNVIEIRTTTPKVTNLRIVSYSKIA